MKYSFPSVVLGLLASFSSLRAETIRSPDGTIGVDFHLSASGEPQYSVRCGDQPAIEESKLGLVRDDADFSKGLTLKSSSAEQGIKDSYDLLTAKRRHNVYEARRRVFHLETAEGKPMDVVFQVSNDGVVFRYEFPGADEKRHKISAEATSFIFGPETKAWIQPMMQAKTGYARTAPSYEMQYLKEVPVSTPSPTGAGWVFPALFKTGETWVALSEGALPRNYCACRLVNAPGGYAIGFPDPRENFQNGAVFPESTLPWKTPWRVVVIGSLNKVAESMLGVDVAEKQASDFVGKPGQSAWSWVLMGDGSINFDEQKRFIDYAAEMHWEYCLIDAFWDKQIGDEKIKELCDYARGKGVAILVWENSAGDWNDTPQTPKSKLLTHADRVQEFERLKKLGVAGVKIDFFGGDGQSVIGYYHDLLEDSAKAGLMVNFHGATVPRGWQRTYPHLMTTEAIMGQEYITFSQGTADAEAGHAATIPFTRNLFDPMDFTPMVLDRMKTVQRRTTSAFELALPVLFTSGIQHLAEIPAGMAKVPPYVRDFLKALPNSWDDSRFIDGYPGRYAIFARRSGPAWYLAGINADKTERKLVLDLHELGAHSGQLITDGEDGNLSFAQRSVTLPADGKVEVTLKPEGGFVAVIQ